MSMGCHSEPLGYDRDFNRYWTFPELSPDIFVESGWATSPASHFPTPVAHAVPERPKILGNFIFLDRFSELYYLKDNGTHEKCNARPIGPPPVAPNTWRVLKPADVQSLVENLNQMGIREGALLTKVKAWLAKQTKDTEPNASRPAPVIAESALEILSELFVKIAGDLIENQLLGKKRTDQSLFFLLECFPLEWVLVRSFIFNSSFDKFIFIHLCASK